jgi:hypothetical protein
MALPSKTQKPAMTSAQASRFRPTLPSDHKFKVRQDWKFIGLPKDAESARYIVKIKECKQHLSKNDNLEKFMCVCEVVESDNTSLKVGDEATYMFNLQGAHSRYWVDTFAKILLAASGLDPSDETQYTEQFYADFDSTFVEVIENNALAGQSFEISFKRGTKKDGTATYYTNFAPVA